MSINEGNLTLNTLDTKMHLLKQHNTKVFLHISFEISIFHDKHEIIKCLFEKFLQKL